MKMFIFYAMHTKARDYISFHLKRIAMLCQDKTQLPQRGNFVHHLDGDSVNGFVTWCTKAGVMRPLCVVSSARRRARWSPMMDVARPNMLCFMVTTTRQPVCGPNLVVSPYVPIGWSLVGARSIDRCDELHRM